MISFFFDIIISRSQRAIPIAAMNALMAGGAAGATWLQTSTHMTENDKEK